MIEFAIAFYVDRGVAMSDRARRMFAEEIHQLIVDYGFIVYKTIPSADSLVLFASRSTNVALQVINNLTGDLIAIANRYEIREIFFSTLVEKPNVVA
jgi:hypothetical protein